MFVYSIILTAHSNLVYYPDCSVGYKSKQQINLYPENPWIWDRIFGDMSLKVKILIL